MMKIISLLAALAVTLAAVAEPRQSVVNSFADAQALKHATVGVCVMDLQSGKVVASTNADKCIVAASTMKVVTAASALELLGANYRYHTRVYAVGDIDQASGRLTGNIVVVGGGDPTLGSRYVEGQRSFVDAVVRRISNAGISSIDGQILLDESAVPHQPVPSYWMLEDLPEGYGTGYHAINFSDNQMRVHFDYNRADGSYSLSTRPAMPWIDLHGSLTMMPANAPAGERASMYSSLSYINPALSLDGQVSNRKRGKESFDQWYANPAPGRLLTDSLTRAMISHGITISPTDHSATALTDTLQLLDYTSPTLTEIIEPTLYRSINMYAEALLRTLATKTGRDATTDNGVRAVRALWKRKGLDVDELSMKDGSGLARNGLATPRFLCNVLRIAYSDFGSQYSTLLPYAGQEGSVKTFLRNTGLRGKISLKSGSMGGVQCYAGYYPAQEPRYAVVVMVNNFTAKRASVRKEIEQLLTGLFL